MRILLVEGAQFHTHSATYALNLDGVVCDALTLTDDVLEVLRLYDYDMIVLDLIQDDISGFSMLKKIREAKISTPVFVLSELSETHLKVKAFELGADDYLTAPFDKNEFLARIHAVVRRSKGYSDSVIRVERLEIDTSARKISYSGIPISLTAKEYAVIELLALRPGVTLSKEVFLSHLYGGEEEPEEKIIDVFVCKLRKKIAEASGQLNFIETVWGRGYLLVNPEAHSSNR
jgi:two-component system cell cycle response regulator CtrA